MLVKDYRERLRDRLHAEIENDRQMLLLQQKRLIADHECIAQQLRDCSRQIWRLLGPPPSKDICPACYYRSGSAIPLINGNSARDGTSTCPNCSLVITS